MKKTLQKLGAILIVMSLILQLGIVNVSADTNWDAYIQRYGDKIDIGPELRAIENNPELKAKMDAELLENAEGNDTIATAALPPADNEENFTYDGGTKKFVGFDRVRGNYYKNFTLRSIGNNVEIWVARDLKYPAGDIRPIPVITQAQVDTLRDEFDNNIYQKDTEFFGMPNSRVGTKASLGAPGYYAPADGKERVIMLVDNCRDENYYNPTYPFYVAGFFSSAFSTYFDRNVINIDTNKWDKRLPTNDIFGTIAHEFQHLIHRDNDPSEENWINEGMADFAQYLCGYGHDWGHVNFFLDHPENSLVSWDEHYSAPTGPETLADYGQAYLLQIYLNDHFGRDFIQALAKDKDQGIKSVNNVMNQFNTGIDFAELFRRFTIALSVDSQNPGNGIYNFSSIDVKVNYAKANIYQKDGVPAWGADYLSLTADKNEFNSIKDIVFNGVYFVTNRAPWVAIDNPDQAGNKVLWGNKSDKNDNKAIIEVDLSNITTATLNFKHKYDIEPGWDFALVQVSDDGGKNWTSLSNANTTSSHDPNARLSIVAQLPGFTGAKNAWSQETFDLSNYAGKKIYIDFRYMTDDGTLGNGWFIDDIQIPEISYINDCSDMSTFINYDFIVGNNVDYMVTFINEKYTKKGTAAQSYQVKTIDPLNITDGERVELQKFLSSGNNYMIIWGAAPIGITGTVDYSYEVITKELKK